MKMLISVSTIIYNMSSFHQFYRTYQGAIINIVLKDKSSSDEVCISTDTMINNRQGLKKL